MKHILLIFYKWRWEFVQILLYPMAPTRKRERYITYHILRDVVQTKHLDRFPCNQILPYFGRFSTDQDGFSSDRKSYSNHRRRRKNDQHLSQSLQTHFPATSPKKSDSAVLHFPGFLHFSVFLAFSAFLHFPAFLTDMNERKNSL